MVLIKEHHHQVFPLQKKQRQGNEADNRQLQCILRGDGEDIAQNDGLNADCRRLERDHEKPEPEERGEDQADDGVFLQLCPLVEEKHRCRCKAAREERADGEGEAKHVSAGNTRND